MKNLFAIMAVLLLASCAGMGVRDVEMTAADEKLTALTALEAAPANDDKLYIVDMGTPNVSKSITVQYLMSWMTDKDMTFGSVTTAAAANPAVKIDSTAAGDDWWIGSNDTADLLEIRQSETPGTSVMMSVDKNGILRPTYGYINKDPYIDDPDDWATVVTSIYPYYFGRSWIANATGEGELDPVASGMGFSLSVDDTYTATVNPDQDGTADTFYLNGAALTQGQAIVMTGPCLCVFEYRAADTWEVQCSSGAEGE